MDKIFIRELQLKTTIGIFEWEKKIKQNIIIDLEFAIDNRQAALNDDINETINYDQVITTIQTITEHQSFNLVETLAEKIADTLLQKFKTSWLKISINKIGAIKQAKGVGVIIERSLQ